MAQATKRKSTIGEQWEATLESNHKRYWRLGTAMVHKRHPPMTILRREAKPRFRRDRSAGLLCTAEITGKAPPDYSGILAAGRSVVLEAKATEHTRWAFSNLKPHQAQELTMSHDMGAVVFVALLLGTEAWVLPWAALKERWYRWHRGEAARGQASVGSEDCEEIGIRMERPGDWLEPLLRGRE